MFLPPLRRRCRQSRVRPESRPRPRVPNPRPDSSDASPSSIRDALERVLHATEADQQPRLLADESRRLSAEARKEGVKPEQLIVAVKQAWADLPEARARRLTPAHGVILERLISLCITSYYDSDGRPAQTRPATTDRPSE